MFKSFAAATTAIVATVIAASPAAAQTNLIRNGNFETTTFAANSGSRQFTTEVTGWTNEQTSGYTKWGYNFLIRPDTADTTGFTSLLNNQDKIYGPNGGVNSANYSNNGFTGRSLSGGNFLLLDGDTNFHGKVSQALSNLTIGQVYALSFDWAAASWFTTADTTTERFDVTFGNQTKSTETLTLPAKGFSGWRSTTLHFTVGAANQTLSFLAQGTPNGLPPSLLLDNVSMAAVPESSTWAMMLVGFGAAGMAMRTRRRRVAIAA